MAFETASLCSWLHKRAEDVSVALMATMFFAFLAQIILRYLTDFPIGWTSELTIVCWLWLVLWGAVFVVRDEEEIRFDLIYGSLGRRTRRVVVMLTSLSLIVLYTISLPAVVDYVTFMKVQRSDYLGIRFDFLFSIYVLFAVATIIRQIFIGWNAIRRSGIDAFDPTKAGSGI
ncbi:TRAP transporter small permease [Lacibacterium aquatile]|uniref:TRAP transporter small permease protein n=1 Tax=Lacibacterium aquatile TaxID=1168082 RepID=A0ABW5DLD7_9PROT